MDADKARIVDVIRRTLTPEQLAQSFIYWNNKSLTDGESVKAGLQTFRMPFEGTVVFVDLAPGANWTHPCLYILVDLESFATKVIEATFPPHIGNPDDSYVMVLRYNQEPSR